MPQKQRIQATQSTASKLRTLRVPLFCRLYCHSGDLFRATSRSLCFRWNLSGSSAAAKNHTLFIQHNIAISFIKIANQSIFRQKQEEFLFGQAARKVLPA
jgi:hypothetical protein